MNAERAERQEAEMAKKKQQQKRGIGGITMRLIDADMLWCKLERESWHDNADRDEIALPLVDDAPTVDAVEVVRCRDCKHRGTDDCIFHIKGEPADEELLRKLDNDFCSYGERIDNGY